MRSTELRSVWLPEVSPDMCRDYDESHAETGGATRASRFPTRRVVVTIACVLALSTGTGAAATEPPQLGPWQLEGHSVSGFTRSQGIATDPTVPGVTLYSWMLGMEWAGAGGHPFRRTFGIPFTLLVEGYLHIGDIDAYGGKAFLPYEKLAGDPEKAFGIVDVRTSRIEKWSVHDLDPGETDHNSWVAVSPDGDWLVSGEWDDMARILVFAVADLGAPEVDVAFGIDLDVPLNRVQGCDFASPVQLVCLDDTEERQLIQIDLQRPLDGSDVTGHPTWLGPTPVDLAVPWLADVCGMPTEAEGVDVQDSTLRFLTIDPCLLWTHEYRYTLTV